MSSWHCQLLTVVSRQCYGLPMDGSPDAAAVAIPDERRRARHARAARRPRPAGTQHRAPPGGGRRGRSAPAAPHQDAQERRARRAPARRRRIRHRGRQGRRGRGVRAGRLRRHRRSPIPWSAPRSGARVAELAAHRPHHGQRRQRDAAEGLSAAAAGAGVTISVQIDVDSGFGRCGVPMDDHGAIEALARLIPTSRACTSTGSRRTAGCSSRALPSSPAHEAGRAGGRAAGRGRRAPARLAASRSSRSRRAAR